MLKHSLIAMAALGILTLSATAGDKIENINTAASDAARIAKEDLGAKKVVTEAELGLRKTDLYAEEAETTGVQAKFDAPAPGSGARYERAFVNAPPMIPHSVEGLLPITAASNTCVSCHLPEVAEAAKATPVPASHFANFRPDTIIGKDGKIVKDGKSVDNTSDFKTGVKKLDKLSSARFNCSQCHAPQANIETAVGNTFQPDFGDGALKASSNLIDVMNAGVE